MPQNITPRRNSVLSADGTSIVYQTVGQGPAVIAIPGVLSTASMLSAFADSLAKRFTVHTIERRGRGGSGAQGESYSIDKDVMDVAAVSQAVNAHYVFGHSFGGLVALEYARANLHVRAVALYEPVVSIDGSLSTAWASSYETKLAEGRALDAFIDFSIAAGPRVGQRTPRWLMKMLLPMIVNRNDLRTMLHLLPENLREHREIARLDNTYNAYGEVSARTLLLFGAKNGLPAVSGSIDALSRVIPGSVVREFPRLDHFGPMKSGASSVAHAVADYFALG